MFDELWYSCQAQQTLLRRPCRLAFFHLVDSYTVLRDEPILPFPVFLFPNNLELFCLFFLRDGFFHSSQFVYKVCPSIQNLIIWLRGVQLDSQLDPTKSRFQNAPVIAMQKYIPCIGVKHERTVWSKHLLTRFRRIIPNTLVPKFRKLSPIADPFVECKLRSRNEAIGINAAIFFSNVG